VVNAIVSPTLRTRALGSPSLKAVSVLTPATRSNSAISEQTTLMAAWWPVLNQRQTAPGFSSVGTIVTPAAVPTVRSRAVGAASTGARANQVSARSNRSLFAWSASYQSPITWGRIIAYQREIYFVGVTADPLAVCLVSIHHMPIVGYSNDDLAQVIASNELIGHVNSKD
jgi:hypothetical protein